jgi:hypothetical protein
MLLSRNSNEMNWESLLTESGCAFSQDCFIGRDEVGGGGLSWRHKMSDLKICQGPEGRGQTPARSGWAAQIEDDPACPGVTWERRRCGTRLVRDHSAKEHKA